MTLRLRSRAFGSFQEIPARYTAEGENLSPPLKWSKVPEGTREFVLICEDPDASGPKPFVHWIVYHISANTTQLPEGLPTGQDRIEYPVLARQGRNSARTLGYVGPRPPFWHGAHHYSFRLYALDQELSVPPDPGIEEVRKAMRGHVLGQAQLMGYFEASWHKRLNQAGNRYRPHAGWGPLLFWSATGALSAALFSWAASRFGRDADRYEETSTAA